MVRVPRSNQADSRKSRGGECLKPSPDKFNRRYPGATFIILDETRSADGFTWLRPSPTTSLTSANRELPIEDRTAVRQPTMTSRCARRSGRATVHALRMFVLRVLVKLPSVAIPILWLSPTADNAWLWSAPAHRRPRFRGA